MTNTATRPLALVTGASSSIGRGAAPIPLPRAVYVATCAHLVALSQVLHAELSPHGVQVQALCPGVVATEFHERQGMDLSAVPRMTLEDVVAASLRGLKLGEVICAPGVENEGLLASLVSAQVGALGGQSPKLATRYGA